MSKIIFKQGTITENNKSEEEISNSLVQLPTFTGDGTLLFSMDNDTTRVWKNGTEIRNLRDGNIYLDKVEKISETESKSYTVDLTGGHYPVAFEEKNNNLVLIRRGLPDLTVPEATDEKSGVVTAGNQSFGGDKSFSKIIVDELIVKKLMQFPGEGEALDMDDEPQSFTFHLDDEDFYWDNTEKTTEERIDDLEKIVERLLVEIKSLKGE